jgi:UDP-N-acetylglucosamine 1-carboxyvinyltransferase
MAALCLADGTSTVDETVFENRFLHIQELQKMGANITTHGNKAIISGVKNLHAAHVKATDIRASCALVLAGLTARGTTTMEGLHHWRRGYDALDKKLQTLGAQITIM